MTSKAKKLGRPSEVGAYVELIRTTPKGNTTQVGNLLTGLPFASHQAADYRRKTILAKFGKSAGKNTVKIVRLGEKFEGLGYTLVLTGRAKSA